MKLKLRAQVSLSAGNGVSLNVMLVSSSKSTFFTCEFVKSYFIQKTNKIYRCEYMLFGTLIIYPLSHFFSKWLNLTRGICHGGSVAEWLGRQT